MEKKHYEAPKVFELGTVKELTESTPEVDKCSGSGEISHGHPLSELFSLDCP
jgi:hypothetical protein